jgi:hypothetical protein
MAGGSFGHRPGDAQARQPSHAPPVHRVLLLDGLVGSRRQRQFHRLLRRLDLAGEKKGANSADAENPACFSSSSLHTYSRFSIACSAVIIAVARFQ